jgi:hypothetical protein
VDIVAADEFAYDSPSETVAADQIADDKVGLDIGPVRFARIPLRARTARLGSIEQFQSFEGDGSDRKPLIAGNWKKLNLNHFEATGLV